MSHRYIPLTDKDKKEMLETIEQIQLPSSLEIFQKIFYLIEI